MQSLVNILSCAKLTVHVVFNHNMHHFTCIFNIFHFRNQNCRFCMTKKSDINSQNKIYKSYWKWQDFCHIEYLQFNKYNFVSFKDVLPMISVCIKRTQTYGFRKLKNPSFMCPHDQIKWLIWGEMIMQCHYLHGSTSQGSWTVILKQNKF